ncbi:Cysteine-rich transmembrane CYSTM domain containing protein [Parasponia andersonii]|uniref:Cysteine-rich transmembrane CYSTM domain containing protein n=1 Tax=Parasponia andersonii TaxID=3476 RepID=A0A2P5DV67_PARAD|nr:Cysteine-rich transmembrane CYSTM domain containing protein [Parasponia andersonii]
MAVVYPPVFMEHSPPPQPPPQSYPPAPVAPQPVVAQYEGYNYVNQGPYVATPPPAGYPTTTNTYSHQSTTTVTNSKGEGFWKGCVAALCCCWVLDFCCC